MSSLPKGLMNNYSAFFWKHFVESSFHGLVFSGTAIFVNDWSKMTQVENVCLE